jgi:hypothetical protein
LIYAIPEITLFQIQPFMIWMIVSNQIANPEQLTPVLPSVHASGSPHHSQSGDTEIYGFVWSCSRISQDISDNFVLGNFHPQNGENDETFIFSTGYPNGACNRIGGMRSPSLPCI